MSTEMAKAGTQEVQKQEVKGEKTVAGKYFLPATDIVETENELLVMMDMPGVRRENVEVKLENRVLEIEGHLDFSPYKDLTPIYSEYSVGHYTRRFTISNAIDSGKIDASLADGVLVLTLPKTPESQPRSVSVS